jgi:AAA family ATP:ADP antiporter
MNTARQMLWLPTSREEKYKAKQAADTFIVRVGDLMSAGLVYVGTVLLGLAPAGFALVNVVACLLWLGVGMMLLKQYRTLASRQAAPATAG